MFKAAFQAVIMVELSLYLFGLIINDVSLTGSPSILYTFILNDPFNMVHIIYGIYDIP